MRRRENYAEEIGTASRKEAAFGQTVQALKRSRCCKCDKRNCCCQRLSVWSASPHKAPCRVADGSERKIGRSTERDLSARQHEKIRPEFHHKRVPGLPVVVLRRLSFLSDGLAA